MAKKVWTTPIEPTNKVDWGTGDSTTGNLPLSGGVVQQYIQDNFDSKAGYFYSNPDAGKCYVFADKETYNKWDGTEDSELVLGVFGITANFTMTIDVSEAESSKSAASGSTGNTITFTWNVKDKRDNSFTTEDANCYLTFTNGTVTKSVSFRISGSNHTVTQNVDEYLLDGENYIDVTVTSLNSKVSSSRRITYNIIALGLTSTYDISSVWSLNGDFLKIPYTITGSGYTITEWWWDGIKLKFQSNVDDCRIQDKFENLDKSINLNSLSNLVADGERIPSVANGRHSLQFRTYVESNGVKFYTDTLYRDVIINTDSTLTTPVFTIATTIPKEKFNAQDDVQLYGLSQYVPYEFTTATYYPGDAASLSTEITIDGMSTVYSIALENKVPVTLEIIPSISGDTTLFIKSSETTRSIPVTISENSLGLSELGESDGLVMNFAADGRTNFSLNRDSWNYNEYTATFSGFKWTETSGWNNGQLFIDNGDSLTLDNYLPFESGDEGNGITLELEYSTNRVLDDTAVICSTIANSGTGIILTATEASLSTVSQKVDVKYKSGETVRITFVIENRSNTNKPLILIYMNGILSGASVWSSADSIQNNIPIKFVGSENASIALKQIRGYNRALTSTQILNNYILYRNTFAEMQELYTRNDIYDNEGSISADKVARYLPVMLITGDIPHLDTRGADEKGDITIMPEVKYIDYIHNKSFVYYNAGMSCQGTSSMTYPKKNYRLYTEEKKLSKPTWPQNVTWTYDPEHSNFFRMDVNDIDTTNKKNWVEQPWSGKKDGKHKVKYSFRDQGEYENGEPMGATRWTIKADFAESSSTHNTGVARLWNNVMYKAAIGTDHPLRTRAQQCAFDDNLNLDVRTCVDGFPIAMFYREDTSSKYIFMGKYNFNNDKSSEDVFGFTDIDSFDDMLLPEEYQKTYSYEEENDDGAIELVEKKCTKYKHTMQCWELTDSGNPVSLFKRTSENLDEMSIKEMGYEARYPDDAEEDAEDKRWRTFVQPFYEWMCDIRDEATITYDKEGHINEWINPSRFSEEKYQWMDVPKMAAYYIYLIRFGAVDQVVKNAMLTSEDGKHWYYINYDNDTILGLNNLGNLVYGPEITRASISKGATDYDYAARDSTLWNCLENDKDFMENVVPQIDEALRIAGLTYDNVIHTFEEEGSDNWCETIYNKDAEYKYISSYKNDKNYLGSLQGARTTHRRWWVSKRFDFYDTKFKNSNFTSKQFVTNVVNPVIPNNTIKIIAGSHGYFGIYEDGKVRDVVELQSGEEHIFSINEGSQIGQNNILLNPHNIYEVDLSNCSKYLAKLDLNAAYDSILGSKMRRLILGSDDSEINEQCNSKDESIKGLAVLANLEYINIQNFIGLNGLEGLDKLTYLKEFDARGSGIKTLSFAKGAPLTKLALPNKIHTLVLSELPLLTIDGIYFEEGGYGNVTSLTIDNCEQLLDSWTWVNKFTNLEKIDLEVNWGANTLINWNDLKSFLNGKSGSLRGTIALSKTDLPNDIIEQLYNGEYKQWFGEGVLNKDNKLYVKLPKNVYLKLSRDTIIEGLGPKLITGFDNEELDKFSDEDKAAGYTILTTYPIGFDAPPSVEISSPAGTMLAIEQDGDSYILYAHETGFTKDTNITIYADFTGGSSSISLKVLNRIYPSTDNTTIVGNDVISPTDNPAYRTYSLKYADTVKGFPISIKWRVDPNEEGHQYVTIANSDTETCTLTLDDNGDDKFESMYNLHLYLDITNPESEASAIISKAITITFSKDAIISESSNPELWEALKRGLVTGFEKEIEGGAKAFTTTDAKNTYPSSTEGAKYKLDVSKLYVAEGTTTDEKGDTITTYSGVKSFNEFAYFTRFGDEGSCENLFADNPVLEEITLLPGRKVIDRGMFSNCKNLKKVTLNSETESIEINEYAFYNCSNLTDVNMGGMISKIKGYSFYGCSSLQTIDTTERLTQIGSNAFYYCTSLKEINLTDNVSYIGSYAFFNCAQLNEIHIPNNSNYTSIEEGTFYFCRSLESVDLPENVKSIKQYGFGTSGVRTVNLNKVTYIGDYAFFSADLQELYIPSTVTDIGVAAFSGNSNLNEYTGDSDYNPIKWKDTNKGSTYLISDPVEEGLEDNKITTYTLKCVVGTVSEFIFPDNIRKIGDYAFYVCNNLQTLSVPNIIGNNIGNYAFYSCRMLSTLVLPYDLTKIPTSMVGFCTNLSKIYIREGSDDTYTGVNDLSKIKQLGSNAFFWCTKLESLYFRDLTSVSDSVFYYCSKLGDITVNNTTPPNISSNNTFGSDFKSYTGSEVSGDKLFYIPTGSEESYKSTWWNSLIENCGFKYDTAIS